MERVTEAIDQEGFRANVGIILTQDGGEVLWARCVKNRGWQFPQGGIDVGETAEEALYRELYEELGLAASDVGIIGYTEGWLRYRLPENYQRKHATPRCVGQKQVWYVLRLLSPETAIRLAAVNHPEFDRWRWVDWWHPLTDVIFFKRRVYDRALTQLAPFVFPGGAPPRPPREFSHRWRAPRSPYRIIRDAPRQESRLRSGTAPESR
ncbi:MAG: RNA pyrophosphohydrolase [Gammaproteobacteria bacterium]